MRGGHLHHFLFFVLSKMLGNRMLQRYQEIYKGWCWNDSTLLFCHSTIGGNCGAYTGATWRDKICQGSCKSYWCRVPRDDTTVQSNVVPNVEMQALRVLTDCVIGRALIHSFTIRMLILWSLFNVNIYNSPVLIGFCIQISFLAWKFTIKTTTAV